MDVDEAGFLPQLVPILTSICDATIVAIDLEMSGIPMKGYGSNDRSRMVGKPNLQELYEEIREAAMKYQVLQMGITCIEEDHERDIYVARPYNFNVSPLLIHGEKLDIKRDITFQSGAVEFLNKHSFDIGAVFTKGVPYISRGEESVARVNYSKKQEMSANIPDIVISPEDDEAMAFYNKARKTIFDFANQKKQELDFVNIGHPYGLNGLQRRLVHQLVRNEFPSCRTFARGGGEFMQVEKLNPEREALIAKQRLATFESSLARQTGLRFIFEALAGGDLTAIDPKWFRLDENNKPIFVDMEALRKTITSLQKALKKKSHVIVGHNIFTDLVFIYRTFVGSLPDRVSEFIEHIHELFPKVFDTKYLATQAGGSMRNKSSLKDLCDELKTRHNPFIALAERHVSYGVLNREHEAGYDSWMTAQVFIKLSSKLAAEQGVVDCFDVAVESETATSLTANDLHDAPLSHPDKDHLSRNTRRVLSSEKELENDTKENLKKKSKGSSIYSTIREGSKLKQRIETPFSNTNIFDNLYVEGQNDSDSTRSSSPDRDNGGVSLGNNDPAYGQTVIGSDVDGEFKASYDESELLKLQAVETPSSSTGVTQKRISGGPNRYSYAAKLNGHALADRPEDGPEENPWIPGMKSSFWKVYANRLRVYATESEICYLGA